MVFAMTYLVSGWDISITPIANIYAHLDSSKISLAQVMSNTLQIPNKKTGALHDLFIM